MNILLVSPEFAESFWSLSGALDIIDLYHPQNIFGSAADARKIADVFQCDDPRRGRPSLQSVDGHVEEFVGLQRVTDDAAARL